ncbi:MAG: hypothetical protein F4139_00115 [Gemmatimonadetes bacterium]|nr:hypothetical protein [Gemmatimonadota bacterium]MYK65894.1 hypothetical protein [Gemmatimonadota bacterium]
MRTFYLLAVLALMAPTPDPQYRAVFEGYPVRRVLVSPDGGLPEALNDKQSAEYASRVVVDREGNYFWESREMKPMAMVVSGAFTVFVAESGYVKTYRSQSVKSATAAGMKAATGVDQYDYVEHVALPGTGGAANYFGNRTTW